MTSLQLFFIQVCYKQIREHTSCFHDEKAKIHKKKRIWMEFCIVWRKCQNGSNFLDRQAWANSGDPDQTAPRTVCCSVYIFRMQCSMVKPHVSTFRIVTAIFRVSEFLWYMMTDELSNTGNALTKRLTYLAWSSGHTCNRFIKSEIGLGIYLETAQHRTPVRWRLHATNKKLPFYLIQVSHQHVYTMTYSVQKSIAARQAIQTCDWLLNHFLTVWMS